MTTNSRSTQRTVCAAWQHTWSLLLAALLLVAQLAHSQEISIEQPAGTTLEMSRVVGWGENVSGQSTAPAGLVSVRAISAGNSHTVALKGGGTVIAWGENTYGQATVPAGLYGVQAISAGSYYTVALQSNGTVVAWGRNNYGETTVPSGLSGVQAISAGVNHTVALKSDGSVVAWGRNDFGQTTIPAGLSGVQAVSAGLYHTVALKSDGTIVAWGDNRYRQGTIPVGLSGVQAISAGTLHTVALKSDGTVVAWGDPTYGATTVPAGLTGVKAISAGDARTVALKSNGTVVAWGYNFTGQHTVPAGITDVQAIAAGGLHTVALRSSTVSFGEQARFTSSAPKTFTIKNTGSNALRIFSVFVLDGNSADFTLDTASMASTLPASVGQTSFSITFTPKGPGLRQSRLRVWNDDMDESTYEILLTGYSAPFADIALFTGDNTEPANEQTSNQSPFVFGNTLIGTSSAQAFTIKNIGPTESLSNLQWDVSGANAGDFTLSNFGSPDLAPNAATTFSVAFTPTAPGLRTASVRIFSNDPDESPFTINLSGTGITPEISVERSDGTSQENSRVAIWGDNTYGQRTIPAGLLGVQAISAGCDYTIALKSNGTVVAWGKNDDGQTTIPVGLTGVQAISAGCKHAAALKSDGTVLAWGNNSSNQTAIPSGLNTVKAISAGSYHTVALKGDSTVVAWGQNLSGQATVPAGLTGVQAISAGAYHTVALTSDGTVVAWGDNTYGQATVPAGLYGVRSISAGVNHTVALKSDGTVVAWGDNSLGQRAIPAGLTDVQAIEAGSFHTIALKVDGTVVGWGDNRNGKRTIPAGLSGVQAISAGDTHTIALKSSAIIFAQQARFTTSESKVFTIRNTGSSPLNITSVSVLTGNAADFTLDTTNMSTVIPAGSGQTFSAAFTPSGPGLSQTILRIVNDDLDEGIYEVLLTGYAPPLADIAVFTGNNPEVANERVDNQSFDFADTLLGSSATQTFTIENIGPTEALTPLSWQIVGANPADFVLSSFGSPNLQPNATASFSLSFSPKVPGLRTAAVRIYSNDPDESPFTINVSGTGFTPEISVEQVVGAALEPSRVIAWGQNNYFQATIPEGLLGVQAISAGFSHSVALKIDGTVLAWGENSYGQTTIPEGLTGVRAISAGGSYTVALKNDGTVVAWGYNSSGQATVPAGLAGVQAISAGRGSHAVALKSDGTVVGWGRNVEGQTTIPPGLTGVQAIAAGGSHTVALKNDGTVVAWGSNSYGQSTIPAGLAGVQAISAGAYHTVALKSDGTVVAWGRNNSGQTTIPPGLTDVQAISAGDSHNIVLKKDGTVVAWGNNSYSQMTVPAGLSGVQAISAGGNHTMALKTSTVSFADQPRFTPSAPKQFTINNTGNGPLHISSVMVFGADASDFIVDTSAMATTVAPENGQTTFSITFTPTALGLRQTRILIVSDDLDESTYDILLTGSSPTLADIAAFSGDSSDPSNERTNNQSAFVFPNTPLGNSATQTFTIKNSGQYDTLNVLRWEVIGANPGDFVISSLGATSLPPGAISNFSVAFTPGATGERKASIIIYSNDPDESPFTINFIGNEISPEISIEQMPGIVLENSIAAWGLNDYGQSTIPAGLTSVRAVSAGLSYTVALTADGTVFAWGQNYAGQTSVPAGLVGVQAISAGSRHTVALKTNGTVIAWGENSDGQATVPAGLTGVRAISAGAYHTVALKNDGTVIAWGSNYYGQSAIPAGLIGVQRISAGREHTVALKGDGTVVAWGRNYEGQTTIPAGLIAVRAISAGGSHTVALKSDGTIAAWGANNYDQRIIPAGLIEVRAISAGSSHTVALKSDGTVAAWGDWRYGEAAVPPGLNGVQAISAGGSHTVALKSPTINFAQQVRYSKSEPKQFTIKNTGTAALHISSVSVLGENAADFAVDTSDMLTTVPSTTGQTAIRVTFTPAAPGLRQAKLRVVNDDLDEGNYEILLTGTGAPNQSPQAVSGIPDQQVRIGTPLTIDLSSYFTDPDRDVLTYSVSNNSNSAAATAAINGLSLQLTGLTAGDTEITLSITDAFGAAITDTFLVTALTDYPVLSPAPYLTMAKPSRLADGSVLLEMNVIPGRSYQVEYSNNLSDWTLVPLQTGAPTAQWIDHSPTDVTQKRFYRVRELTTP